MMQGLALAFGTITTAGCFYWLAATACVVKFGRKFRPGTTPQASITILKPLHGAEPGLAENLLSFVGQDYQGAVTIVFGIQDPADPAIPIVQSIIRSLPDRSLSLIVSNAPHGANPKISNLINMAPAISSDIVVLADSDIRVERDYLARIVAALEEPGVGAVTCAYHGGATRSLWSKLSGAAIDAHFLPNVIFGVTARLATPCFGATIAMRRETLDRIGGFLAFSDVLADDYAIGEAVRMLGLTVEIPPFLVTHLCSETSLPDLVSHEIRWAKTVAGVDRAGFIGTGVTHVIPLSIIAAMLGGWLAGGALLVSAAFLCRCLAVKLVARRFAVRAISPWLLPLRDCLSFCVYIASFFPSNVRWKERDFRIKPDGRMIARRESE